MKIAIFISAREPSDGGGYTLTKDLFDNIIKLYNPEKLFFIIRGSENKYFTNKLQKLKIEYKTVKDNKLVIFIKSVFFEIFNFDFLFVNNINNTLLKKKN